jgi:glutamyl-tRNA reductase
MNLTLLGVNHKTAPVEMRERLAIPEARVPETLLAMTANPEVKEAMLVSTCNRVEFLAHANGNGPAELRHFITQRFSVGPGAEHFYEYRDEAAVRHIFRVASSLDSMVVGEPQILGQMKEAYALARSAGTLHGNLDALLTRSFAVAKRVRTETAIGSSAVSIASVAVELAKKIFGTLQGRTVYLVGAGKMSELAARHLIAHGAQSIFVANRTHERAVELASRFSGQAICFEELYDTADRADILITSTGAPHAIFRREHAERFVQRRRNRPMFFIDIAVPRDVDPEVGQLEGMFVYDIDDLQSVVASHVSDRRREAQRAEEIIDEEVRKFVARTHTLDVVPTIVSLQDQLETIRQAEIDKVRGRLGTLTPEQELAVEAMTRGIINKVLHAPITTLKSAARGKDAESTTLVEQVRRIFNLEREKKESGQG